MRCLYSVLFCNIWRFKFFIVPTAWNFVRHDKLKTSPQKPLIREEANREHNMSCRLGLWPLQYIKISVCINHYLPSFDVSFLWERERERERVINVCGNIEKILVVLITIWLRRMWFYRLERIFPELSTSSIWSWTQWFILTLWLPAGCSPLPRMKSVLKFTLPIKNTSCLLDLILHLDVFICIWSG